MSNSHVSHPDWRQKRIVELLDDALTGRDIDRVKSFMSEDC